MYFTLFQSKQNHWCEWESVGIEELSGMEYEIITEGMVRSLFGLLGPALSKVLSTKRLTKEEEDMTTSSLTLFHTPTQVDL